MKKLTNGSSLIVSFGQRIPGRHKHDAWLVHAVAGDWPYLLFCGSGQWVMMAGFQLKSLDWFWYPLFFGDLADYPYWSSEFWLTWSKTDWELDCRGELYNYNFRKLAYEKIPDANLLAWLAAH